MGTNFYIRQRVSHQQKIEMEDAIAKDDWSTLVKLIPEEIHIGKRSAGWKFLWNANNFEYFQPNKESLIKFLKSGDIYDEYGDHFTFDQFWNDEIKFFINCEELYDIESYYKDNPREYYYTDNNRVSYFRNKWNVNINRFGEFYIDNLRFTECDNFS